jgi:alpha-mannosidase
LGGRTHTTLRFSRGISALYETDMLEDNGKEIPFAGNEASLEFKPFEIKTLKVTLI